MIFPVLKALVESEGEDFIKDLLPYTQLDIESFILFVKGNFPDNDSITRKITLFKQARDWNLLYRDYTSIKAAKTYVDYYWTQLQAAFPNLH